MKLGSLFDGIGGFPLAGLKHGIEPVWASEIELFPIAVTTQRFPGMKHLGSVCDINGADIEPVDIITFGSPCQDLSVAGKRAGMDGDRSSLFFEAVRIIREMREATNGLYPRFAVWENVPGAFSSNQGHDFRAVLEALSEAEVPMPATGKWATAGMVRGEGRSLAWRVLDAQHWGVPQRRRRIFLVTDFGGQAAPEILFESEGMCRDIAESRTAWEEAATTIEEGVGVYDNHPADSRVTGPHKVCPTASARWGTGGNNLPLVMAMSTKQQSLMVSSNVANTLGANDYKEPQAVMAFAQNQREEVRDLGDKATSLAAESGMHQRTYVAIQHSMIGRSPQAGPGGPGYRDDGKMWTLDSRGAAHAVATSHIRRLTPVECERLQGYPDEWTDISGASDSKRYKALGNSVAVPCVAFVLENIAKAKSL